MWARAWFQLQWPKVFQHQLIAVKELLPIVMACILWGKKWRNTSMLAHYDNQAVVEVVNSGYSKDAELMQLLWCLFLVKALLSLTLWAVHIKGRVNTIAGAISRNNMVCFYSQAALAYPSPSQIPAATVDLLVLQQPNWISKNWSLRSGELDAKMLWAALCLSFSASSVWVRWSCHQKKSLIPSPICVSRTSRWTIGHPVPHSGGDKGRE